MDYYVPVAQWLEDCVSSAKIVGSIPREHTYWQKKCIAWMHCKSLWIKASAKWKCTLVISVKLKRKQFFIYFFHCIHTQIFWIDVELFIKKMLDISLQLSGFNVIIYFGDHGFDKVKSYLIQLLILIRKFHIHKLKWSGSKPNFSHFINDFKLYC